LTSEPSSQASSAPGDIFATTQWTVVLAAGQERTPEAAQALEELCRTYWFPLYAYVRRRGQSREEAQDLTQSFFGHLLAKNPFAKLDSGHGRFRAFLLASLKNFLTNEYHRQRTLKRGGGQFTLSLDWQTADTQFQLAATPEASPEKTFDREWATALLAKVIHRLQAECAADGKAALFDHLKGFLTPGQAETARDEVATTLRMEAGALRIAIHRLRKRYRQLLHNEIAHTLADPTMVDEEMQALFAAFA